MIDLQPVVMLDDVKVQIPHSPAAPPMLIRRPSSQTPDTATWSSPCGTSWNVACIRFSTQYVLIVGLITFFAVGLYKSDTCEDSNLYSSLLMLVIGIGLPSPSLH